MRGVGSGVLLAIGALGAAVWAAPQDGPADFSAILIRISDRVEAYYSRARSILCTETVRLQPLGYTLSPEGHPRELVYELRVSWDRPEQTGLAPEANVLRQLRSVDGRPPRPRDKPGCMDPKPVSLDPLMFLRAERQNRYKFTYAGKGRTSGQSALMIDYKPAGSPPPDIKWSGDCVTIDLPDRTTGRVWIDASTHDVLRLDEHVEGPFELPIPPPSRHLPGLKALTVDRSDSSIRYKRVTFRNPDETVLLPESIDTVQIIQGSAEPRMRISQRFSNYQRFMIEFRFVR